MKQKHLRVSEHQHVRQQQTAGYGKPVQSTAWKANTDQPIPLWTKTGELFQPVRLYYRIRNHRKLRKHLETLTCMRQESDDNHWAWLHSGEASGITFEKTAARTNNPVELGSLLLWGENGMVLDTHSIERALAAMIFFDRHVPRRLAHMSHVSIVNHLFDPQHAHTFQFPYCSASDAQVDDPVIILLKKMDRLNKRRRSPQEKHDAVTSYLQAMPPSTFPRIEHLALRFSRKRLRQIRFLLESRQYVAIQRWKGNDHLTPADYVYTLIHAETPTSAMK